MQPKSKNFSLHDRYCIEICKAKCCYSPRGVKCPNLTTENKCAIHNLWKGNTCNYEDKDIKTVPIMVAIEKRWIADDIIAGCCYAHPELLRKLDEPEHNI